MITVLKSLLTSRKFWVLMLGSTVANVMTQLHVPTEITLAVLGLFGVNIGGIAYEDGKKSEAAGEVAAAKATAETENKSDPKMIKKSKE